ncbi:hypothetical protein E3J62_00635 [candidate division TA06 bacterium]|uniref:Uncharacterized protein n=1 Tax=candidate division TA06 bacterium TaxID=2250710 RepID=A0A523UYX7_UNCT6|nr:MAG: hypothetical protein E3J62_00635 [candidate division TA06 bacterium]
MRKIHIWAIVFCLFTFRLANAGRLPEAWDHLPALGEIRFSEKAVGFLTVVPPVAPQRFFVLEREKGLFHEVDSASFSSEFPEQEDTCEPPKRSTAWLCTDRNIYFAEPAYCSEGGNRHHILWKMALDRGVPLKVQDHVDRCLSISGIRIISGNLWLGTRYSGEYGYYPGEGIIVQSLDTGELVCRIDAEHGGLTGGLVWAIALDPKTSNARVTTEWGINEIQPTGRIVGSLFLYEDFNGETGAPEIRVSPTETKGNPFATLVRTIGIDDTEAFYKTLSKIPKEMMGEVTQLSPLIIGSQTHPFETPVDRRWNALVPFILKATQNKDRVKKWYADRVLAMFDDMEARKYFVQMLNSATRPYEVGFALRYLRSRVSGENETRAQEMQILRRRIEQAISDLETMNMRSTRSKEIARTLVALAPDLQSLGSPDGYKAIEDYFQKADFDCQRDAVLLKTIAGQIYRREELVPAFLIALRRISAERAEVLASVCSVFDMTRTEDYRGAVLYSTDYVLALLSAFVRANAVEGVDLSTLSGCEQAILSQLRNPEVRSEFVSRIRPGLKGDEAKFADILLGKSQSN